MKLPTRDLALTIGALALVAVLAACASSAADSATLPTQAVSSADSPIEPGTQSGSDSDIMSAQLMIPHHEQALQMADLALDKATSREIANLAQEITAAQGPEIETMRS